MYFTLPTQIFRETKGFRESVGFVLNQDIFSFTKTHVLNDYNLGSNVLSIELAPSNKLKRPRESSSSDDVCTLDGAGESQFVDVKLDTDVEMMSCGGLEPRSKKICVRSPVEEISKDFKQIETTDQLKVDKETEVNQDQNLSVQSKASNKMMVNRWLIIG